MIPRHTPNPHTMRESLYLLGELNDARRLHLPAPTKMFEAKLDEHDMRCGYDKAKGQHFGEPVTLDNEKSPQRNPNWRAALDKMPYHRGAPKKEIARCKCGGTTTTSMTWTKCDLCGDRFRVKPSPDVDAVYDPDKCPSCGNPKGDGRCMACGFS